MMENKTTNIIDYLSVFVKWRKLIIINFIIFTFITALISLIIPKTFTAKTTILPPSEQSKGIGISQLVGSLPLGGFGLGGISGDTNIFMAILNSRTVMEALAKKFNLMDLYKLDNMEETIKILGNNVETTVNEDGTISVSVSAHTGFMAYDDEEKNKARYLARDIANAFIEELDKVNSRLKTEQARNYRMFIEKRYLQSMANLEKAEDELKKFQETYGIIALPEQTEASITAAAELNAKITVKEIEIAVLSKYVSSSHGKLKRAKNELKELKRKFDEIKSGTNYDITDDKNGKYDANLFIPLSEVPNIGLKYLRLFREVTLQEKLLEFLLPQYEQAKIQEAKDTPTVQVLDEAYAPIRRTSPKRTIMVLFSGFLSLIMSVCLIFIFEFWQRIKAEGGDEYDKIKTALSYLKRDLHLKSKN